MWYKAMVPDTNGYWCKFNADYIEEGNYCNLAKLKTGEVVAILPHDMVIFKENSK